MGLQKEQGRLDMEGHLVFLCFYPLGNWPHRYCPLKSTFACRLSLLGSLKTVEFTQVFVVPFLACRCLLTLKVMVKH